MRATDAFFDTFSAAGNSSEFIVAGGRYVLSGASASWGGGSLDVEQLQSDATTWVVVSPLFGASHITANGTVYYDLPPGTYRFTLTTTTAATAALERVPLE